MDQPPQLPQEQPSPWPALAFAFAGGGLALAGVSIQRPAVEFLACGCLLVSWYLARLTTGDQQATEPGEEVAAPPAPADHPMARRSTQLLLLVLALIVGGVGALRVVRGG